MHSDRQKANVQGPAARPLRTVRGFDIAVVVAIVLALLGAVYKFGKLEGRVGELGPDKIEEAIARGISAIDAKSGGVAGMPAPVGSIVAWHKTPNPKDHEKKLTLPPGWVECDGEPLPAGSPLLATGATHTPDLNGKHKRKSVANPDGTVTLEGYNTFLRGATRSGAFELDSTKRPNAPFTIDDTSDKPQGGHTHALPGGDTGSPINSVFQNGGNGRSFSITVGGGNHGHSITGGGDPETRPVNMSVVWIIRVK